jgi:chromosome segregation ATPase
MSEKLKQCPFCGGEAELCYSEVDTFCRKCNVMQETELWNTRPIEDASNARIAELEAKVTKCHELQDSYCDRIAELEAELGKDVDLTIVGLRKELLNAQSRIAELEALVDELVNIGDNLFDSLNPIAWKHEWLDKWWKLSSCRRGEREE